MIEHLTFDEYRARDGINASMYKGSYESSMEELKVAMEKDHGTSDALEYGNLVHTAILEPDLLPGSFAVWSGGDKRTKAWKEFKDEHEGETIITQQQAESLPIIARNIAKDHEATRLMRGSDYEVCVSWTASCGAKCKARIDILSDDRRCVADIKTMANTNKWAFWNQVDKLGYWLQVGHYVEGVRQEFGLEHNPEFWFVCIGSVEPYSVICRPMSAEYIEFSRQESIKMVNRIHVGRTTGCWTTLAQEECIEEIPLPKKWREEKDISIREVEACEI